jgi:hypothetical protein
MSDRIGSDASGKGLWDIVEFIEPEEAAHEP